MTAGFNYNRQAPALLQLKEETNGACPTREFARALAKEPLDFEPGSKYQYSLCHDVLAAFVEVVSGQNFEEYVQEHIFKPLGMTRSTFLATEEDLQEVAPKYVYREATGKVDLASRGNGYRLGTEHASGGAGCVSTVEDYMKFLEALRIGDVILKKETIDMMATNRCTEEQLVPNYAAAQFYGYGLGVRTPKEGSDRKDFGWGGAAGAYLAIDRERGLSVYYAQHMLASPNNAIRNRVYLYALEELSGEVQQQEKDTGMKVTY